MTEFLCRILFFNRYLTLGVIFLATALWGIGIPGASFQTVFEDLLPQGHPIVENYFKYRSQYGNQDSVQLILENREGNIYDPRFLKAVDQATRDFETIPGINKERITSLTSRKLRSVHTDGETIYSDPLVDPNAPLPSTKAQLGELRASVVGTPGVLGQWVSWDHSAVLIDGALVPGASDYKEVFARLKELAAAAEETAVVRTMMLGRPVLTGWIYSFDGQVGRILLISLAIVLVMVAVYSRSATLVTFAALASGLSIVWGLGLLGYLGDNLDPLVLVVPILHVARALSHSVQMGLRYQELQAAGLKRVEAGRELFRRQFTPGGIGILCDALGLFLIAIADIPIMQKLALFVGFWTISMLVNVMMVFPIMVSFLPDRPAKAMHSRVLGRHPVIDMLGGIAVSPRGRAVTWAVALALAAGSVALSTQVSMGNPQPGSPLLWPDSDYNRAIAFYNEKFLGVDQLTVVVQAGSGDVRNLRYVNAVADLQARLEGRSQIAGSVSFVDLLPQIRRIFWGNYPKAEVLPLNDQESGAYTNMLLNGASPGDFDRFFDRQYRHASVTFFLKDTATPTVNAALRDLREAITAVESQYDIEGAFEIGLGSASLQAAVNDEVHFSHYASFIGAVVLMIMACLLAYRSMTLSLILVVPLVLTNFVVLATMTMMGIGLDVNTLPIIAVGMGVGIDYGIYLMSRMIEETGRQGSMTDVGPAVMRSLETTGSAIWLTAITMVFSVGVWYFLSDLRFQAEMGLLLALIMLINLVGALLFVPVQVMSFGRGAVLERALAGGGVGH